MSLVFESFLNYNHDFLSSNTGVYDTTYAKDITNLLGQKQMICNFSEYSLDKIEQLGRDICFLIGRYGEVISHRKPIISTKIDTLRTFSTSSLGLHFTA